MNPKHFKRAMGDVTALADSAMDEELKALAASKAPPPVEAEESEGMESGEAEMADPTPEELERLKRALEMLAQEG